VDARAGANYRGIYKPMRMTPASTGVAVASAAVIVLAIVLVVVDVRVVERYVRVMAGQGRVVLARQELRGRSARGRASTPDQSLGKAGQCDTRPGDSSESETDNVRRGARSTSVAADGRHRSMLAVLTGGLGHSPRHDRLHAFHFAC
jgi:hypothetical protein